MTIFKKVHEDIGTEGRRPDEAGGGDWGAESTSQGTEGLQATSRRRESVRAQMCPQKLWKEPPHDAQDLRSLPPER